jgi:hypothetical protein
MIRLEELKAYQRTRIGRGDDWPDELRWLAPAAVDDGLVDESAQAGVIVEVPGR